MHRFLVRCISWCLALCIPPVLYGQEGRITLTGMAGPAILSLSQVEDDGRRDVEIYNQRGIPIGDYDPMSPGLSVEGQIEYRFDRDLSMNLFVVHTRTGAETMFRDTAQYLSLDRTITSTDVGIDLRYYLPPLIYGAEASLFIGLGRMSARAEQKTNQDHQVKSADTTITIIDQEAFARYDKTKLYVRAGGAFTVPVFSAFLLRAEAVYKYAPLGKLDGELREFTLVRPHTTTIEFDFSTIDLKLGLSYVIE